MTDTECGVCGGPSETPLCEACAEDLAFLELVPPEGATRDELRAWAKAHDVTVFRCGARELGPMGGP